MAQKSEYKVLQENNPTKLGAGLVGLAAHGWHPILMSSTTAQSGAQAVVIVTVILERILG